MTLGLQTLKSDYRLLGLIGVLVSAGIGAWIWQSDNPLEVAIFQPAKPTKEVDFMLENFTSQQFNQAGMLHYQLTASRLTHYPHSQSALIELPSINFYNDQKSPWVATSRSGLLQEENETIIMSGQVKIEQQLSEPSHHPSTQTNEELIHEGRDEDKSDLDKEGREKKDKYAPWRLEADQLTLRPKHNSITSDEQVTISSQAMRIQATGLKANTLTHKIELMSNVRGFHIAQ